MLDYPKELGHWELITLEFLRSGECTVVLPTPKDKLCEDWLTCHFGSWPVIQVTIGVEVEAFWDGSLFHPVVQKDGVIERLLCKRLDSVCGSILRSPFCLETWLNQSLTAAVGWTAPSVFWVCSLPHTWASTSRCPERAWATHPAGVDFHSSVPWEPCSYLLIATCSPCTLPSSGRSYSVRKLHSGVSKLGSLAAWRGWTPSGVLASLHHEVPMVTEILCWVTTAAAPWDE